MKQQQNNLKSGCCQQEAERIEIFTIAIEGSYDDHKQKVISGRKETFYAQMFGSFANAEVLATLEPAMREEIAQLAPDFSP